MLKRSLALILSLVAAGCGAEPETTVEPALPHPATLVLAGDGEMWVVDVATEQSRHIEIPELRPGDPIDRVVRRGERFVLWGYDTYAMTDVGTPLKRIADHTWFFIPSANPDRVWVMVRDPASPATRNALKAVREVTADGEVTVPDVEPPDGRWPEAAVDSGLLIYRDGATSVWDARTGSRREAPAPEGRWFNVGAAAFSPDGRRIAIPIGPAHGSPPESPSELAILDVNSLEIAIVPGSTVPPYYIFTAWSAASDQVFLAGGERFKRRTIVAYRIGDQRARTVNVDVGDFYDMAAR